MGPFEFLHTHKRSIKIKVEVPNEVNNYFICFKLIYWIL